MEMRPLKLVILLTVAVVMTGCSPKNKPVPLPAGATFEVHAIAATKTASTKQGTDPRTDAPLLLQNPPIIATADVARVMKSVETVQTASGAPSESSVVSLKVDLTPAWAAKMATATPSLKGSN